MKEKIIPDTDHWGSVQYKDRCYVMEFKKRITVIQILTDRHYLSKSG